MHDGDRGLHRRLHAVVGGTVQGVGYRFAVRRAALSRAVTGWVRNRRDGTVEIEIEGAPDDVAGVLSWLAKGPTGASVTSVDVTEVTPTGDSGFEVRPTL